MLHVCDMKKNLGGREEKKWKKRRKRFYGNKSSNESEWERDQKMNKFK